MNVNQPRSEFLFDSSVRRRGAVGRWLVACGALTALTAVGSRAAAEGASDGEFSVQRFDPAPGPRNFFTTRGARTDGEMAWSAGLFLNYAYKPFVLRSCVSNTDCDSPNAVQRADIPVVESLFTGDLMGSLTIIPRLQLGLRVPVTYAKGQGFNETGQPNSPDGLQGVGMGDTLLEGKMRLWGEVNDPVVAGAGLFFTGPLGHATSSGNYIGDSTPNVGGRLIFDGSSGPLAFGFNLVGLYRGTGRVGSTNIGSEARYNIAVAYKVSPVFRVLADGFGATKFSSKNGTNALEIDGGVQIMPLGSPVAISVGAGTGVIEGVGVPVVRVFAGFQYSVEARDQDDDGILDASDQCPTEKEDKDGFEDSDGCPDVDNDGDSVPDSADKCPKDAEDPDGFEDTDGCAELDNDKDGVNDDHDRCPDKPETKNGYKDDDGCPDVADTDNDGVPDAKDKCPKESEDTDGFEDTDGCPDPDNDKDGVPDDKDECIDEPETANGFEDEDGCPDEAPKAAPGKPGEKPPEQLVKVTSEGIQILDRVEFGTNDAKIVGKRSFQVLDAVVAVLKAHPEIALIEVQGHTDDKGDAAKNKALSQRRAEEVKKYLVKKGVAPDRLTAAGYGQEQPVADNGAADGRQKNRRVEFKIVKHAE